MMTLVALFFTFLYFKLDYTEKRIFALPSSIFLLLYALSFDLINWEDMALFVFQIDTVSLGFRSYLLFFITAFSFSIGISLCRFRIVFPQCSVTYDLEKMKRIYYGMGISSLVAFVINLIRVFQNGGMELLFIDPRAYEEVFGASFAINYIYFLNVPALCLYIYLRNEKVYIKYALMLNILLVLISFFHGIKFTIFDTILFPVIFYYLLKDKVSLKPLFLTFGALLGVFILFSELVRGGDTGSPFLSLSLYVLPNFYNLSYDIETSPVQFGAGGAMSLFIPDKLPNWADEIQIGESISGFVLNDSYNMFTTLYSLYKAFNIGGPLFFIFIFLIQYVSYVRRNYSIVYLFFSAYLLFCMFFSFYFYAYTKTKNVYYVVLFILIHLYCKRRSSVR